MCALAAGGQDGVGQWLEIIRREIDQAMALLGCASVAEIDAATVHLRPGFAGRRPQMLMRG
ncbi:alpha-hydroxy-acid oxidizing protein [Conexibacter sp. DBS9H8]|uniref:alpha-hydroxy-acid oxidizing protein n=1 Tax=Conexibacter sp. DBS9H8 TaxID=2937801 RepID=UPI0035308438